MILWPQRQCQLIIIIDRLQTFYILDQNLKPNDLVPNLWHSFMINVNFLYLFSFLILWSSIMKMARLLLCMFCIRGGHYQSCCASWYPSKVKFWYFACQNELKYCFIHISINKNTLRWIRHLKKGIKIGCNCVDGIIGKQVKVSGLVAFRIFRDWNFNAIINEDGSWSLKPVLGSVIFTWVRHFDV